MKSFSEFINETLKTNNIDLTINSTKLELSQLRYNFDIVKNINNTITISLFNLNTTHCSMELYLEAINDILVNRHGWFPSYMIVYNLSEMVNNFQYDIKYLVDNSKYLSKVDIIYESKYDIEVAKPSKLYHLSIQEFEKKSIENGLIPKSKSKISKHLDRIYLCKDIKDCYSLINRMKIHYSLNRLLKSKINDKWIIYELNIENLDLKLYKDPNYNNGYYVVDNIPKELILIIDKE